MSLENYPEINYQNEILSDVLSGKSNYNYTEINSVYKNHSAKFYIFDDALKVEGIRVNVSATTMQKVADFLECILPTAKLYDLMFLQAEEKIPPFPRAISSTKKDMIAHSKNIDMAQKTSRITSTVGKVWILDNQLSMINNNACNYGWHFVGDNYQGITGGLTASSIINPKNNKPYRMIQSRGFHHDRFWVDYSQICVLVSKECEVDGETMNIIDLLKNPELAPLANHDGVLKVLKQPGI